MTNTSSSISVGCRGRRIKCHLSDVEVVHAHRCASSTYSQLIALLFSLICLFGLLGDVESVSLSTMVGAANTSFSFTGETISFLDGPFKPSLTVKENLTLVGARVVTKDGGFENNFILDHNCTATAMHVRVKGLGVFNNASSPIFTYKDNLNLRYTNPSDPSIDVTEVLATATGDPINPQGFLSSPYSLQPVNIDISDVYFIDRDPIHGNALLPSTTIEMPIFVILAIKGSLPPGSRISLKNISVSAPRLCLHASILEIYHSSSLQLSLDVAIVVSDVTYPLGIATDAAYMTNGDYGCQVIVNTVGGTFEMTRNSSLTIANITLPFITRFDSTATPFAVLGDRASTRLQSRRFAVQTIAYTWKMNLQSTLSLYNLSVASNGTDGPSRGIPGAESTSTSIIFWYYFDLRMDNTSKISIYNFTLRDCVCIAHFKSATLTTNASLSIVGDTRITADNLLANPWGIAYLVNPVDGSNDDVGLYSRSGSLTSPPNPLPPLESRVLGLVTRAQYTHVSSSFLPKATLSVLNSWSIESGAQVSQRALFVHASRLTDSSVYFGFFSCGNSATVTVTGFGSALLFDALNMTSRFTGSALRLQELFVSDGALLRLDQVHLANVTDSIGMAVAVFHMNKARIDKASQLAVHRCSLITANRVAIDTLASEPTSLRFGILLNIENDLPPTGYLTIDIFSVVNVTQNRVVAMRYVTILGEGKDHDLTVTLTCASRIILRDNTVHVLASSFPDTAVRLFRLANVTASLNNYNASTATAYFSSLQFLDRAPYGSNKETRPNAILLENNRIVDEHTTQSSTVLAGPFIELGAKSLVVDAVPPAVASAPGGAFVRTLILSIAFNRLKVPINAGSPGLFIGAYLLNGTLFTTNGPLTSTAIEGRACGNSIGASNAATLAAVNASYGPVQNYTFLGDVKEQCSGVGILGYWELQTITHGQTVSLSRAVTPSRTGKGTATATVTLQSRTDSPSKGSLSKSDSSSMSKSESQSVNETGTFAIHNTRTKTIPLKAVPKTPAPTPPAPPQPGTLNSEPVAVTGISVSTTGTIIIGAAPAAALAQSVAIVAIMPCNVGQNSQSHAMRILITPLKLPDSLGRLQFLLGSVVLVVGFTICYFLLIHGLVLLVKWLALRRLLLHPSASAAHDSSSRGLAYRESTSPSEGSREPNDTADDRAKENADAPLNEGRPLATDVHPQDGPPNTSGGATAPDEVMNITSSASFGTLAAAATAAKGVDPNRRAVYATTASGSFETDREWFAWWVDRPKVLLLYPRLPMRVLELLLPGIVFEAGTLLYGAEGVFVAAASSGGVRSTAGVTAGEVIVAMITLVGIIVFIIVQHVIALQWYRAAAAVSSTMQMHHGTDGDSSSGWKLGGILTEPIAGQADTQDADNRGENTEEREDNAASSTPHNERDVFPGVDGYMLYEDSDRALLPIVVRPLLARGFWCSALKRSRLCVLSEMHGSRVSVLCVSVSEMRSFLMAIVGAIGSANAGNTHSDVCAGVLSVVALISFAHALLVLLSQCYRSRITNVLTGIGSIFVGLSAALTVDNNLFFNDKFDAALHAAKNQTSSSTTGAVAGSSAVVAAKSVADTEYHARRSDAIAAFAVMALLVALCMALYSFTHVILEWVMRRGLPKHQQRADQRVTSSTSISSTWRGEQSNAREGPGNARADEGSSFACVVELEPVRSSGSVGLGVKTPKDKNNGRKARRPSTVTLLTGDTNDEEETATVPSSGPKGMRGRRWAACVGDEQTGDRRWSSAEGAFGNPAFFSSLYISKRSLQQRSERGLVSETSSSQIPSAPNNARLGDTIYVLDVVLEKFYDSLSFRTNFLS